MVKYVLGYTLRRKGARRRDIFTREYSSVKKALQGGIRIMRRNRRRGFKFIWIFEERKGRLKPVPTETVIRVIKRYFIKQRRRK